MPVAYNDRLGAAQTATKAAAELTAAFITAGHLDSVETGMEFFNTQSSNITAELTKLADASPAPSAPGAPRNYPPKGAGKSKGVESDGSLVLKGGAFDGYTIAQVWAMDKSDIQANGIEYDRTGQDYVNWLAENKHPKAGFKRDRAKAFVEAQQAGVAE
jgi:hypothetical protein